MREEHDHMTTRLSQVYNCRRFRPLAEIRLVWTGLKAFLKRSPQQQQQQQQDE